MTEFLLIFRRGAVEPNAHLSPEQLQAMMKPWQEWIGSLEAQNKLADRGNRLEHAGKVIRPGGVITDGPYVETKEAVGGYTMIRANSMEEAIQLSKDCPILAVGGNVEVRAIIPMEGN